MKEEKYRDHELTGKYKGTRECHVEPDWLLIYEIRNVTIQNPLESA
ncbi:MAG: type II toxin-antitoxin system mRNA interferase toxin, RelE/StbE family [Lachnospiraceae bacterium]|nr:type II toxin-antitoxin system mRNA interferase toxin, RelE/StbE family [Lachnospiraceae bacterium]